MHVVHPADREDTRHQHIDILKLELTLLLFSEGCEWRESLVGLPPGP